jgi:hypothetical protein
VEEEEDKISSLNSIQRTFCILFQTLILQFGAIPTGMSRSFLCSVFITILFSVVIMVPVSLDVTPAYAQGPPIAPDNDNQGLPPGPPQRFPLPFDRESPFAQAGNFSFGPIGSIQNNETGQPAWVAVGTWRGNLLSFNETTIATTETGDGNASSLAAAAVFNADFRMIMLNGSHAHTHVITNFRLSNISSNENGTTTYTGNSTISMPEAAFEDVPTTIKVSGEIISIYPEPSKVNEHYGNTPIYGVVLVEEEGLRRPPHGPAPFP